MQQLITKFTFPFFLILILLSGCEYKKVTNSPVAGENSPFSEKEVITFETVRASSLKTCARCHDTYANYADVKNDLALILAETSSGSMPPQNRGFSALTTCEQKLLETWSDIGAPETSDVLVSSIVECAQSKPSTPPSNPTLPPVDPQEPVDNPPIVPPTDPISPQPVTPDPQVPPVVEPVTPPELITAQLIQNTSLKTCTTCHKSYSSVDVIRSKIDRILTRVENDSMPPQKKGYAPLNSCEKQMLRAWYTAGMPEKTDINKNSLLSCAITPVIPQPDNPPVTPPQDNPPPVVTPPPVVSPEPPQDNTTPILDLERNYAILYNRILGPKCSVCHNAQNEDTFVASFLFAPYEEILTQKKLWTTPGDRSRIVRIVGRGEMPPQDSGIEPLTPEEIQYLIEWIDLGKPK